MVMPRGVLLDQRQHLLPQPAGGGEQPLPGALAQRQVQGDVAGRLLQTVAEGRDVGRQQGDVPRLAQRQPDVGRADHLGGQLAQALAELQAEHARAGGPQHRSEHLLHARQARAWRPASLAAEVQRALHRVRDVAGDRLDQPPPHRQRLLDPLRPAPGGDRGADPREGGRLVQPQLGQRDGLDQRALLAAVRAGVGPQRGRGLAGGVLGHLPVDPGVGVRRAAGEHRPGAAEHGERALQLRGQGVHVPTGQGGEQRLERVARLVTAGSGGLTRALRPAGPAEPVRLGLGLLRLVVGRARLRILRHRRAPDVWWSVPQRYAARSRPWPAVAPGDRCRRKRPPPRAATMVEP